MPGGPARSGPVKLGRLSQSGREGCQDHWSLLWFSSALLQKEEVAVTPPRDWARCSHMAAGLVYCYNQYQLALNSICYPQALGVLTVLVWVYNVIKLI